MGADNTIDLPNATPIPLLEVPSVSDERTFQLSCSMGLGLEVAGWGGSVSIGVKSSVENPLSDLAIGIQAKQYVGFAGKPAEWRKLVSVKGGVSPEVSFGVAQRPLPISTRNEHFEELNLGFITVSPKDYQGNWKATLSAEPGIGLTTGNSFSTEFRLEQLKNLSESWLDRFYEKSGFRYYNDAVNQAAPDDRPAPGRGPGEGPD